MIAREFERKCLGGHVHGQLLSGGAGSAVRYTPDMCNVMVRGIIVQKELDNIVMVPVDGVESIKALKEEQ